MVNLSEMAAEEQAFILSTLPPGPAQRRFALGLVVFILVACLLIAGPLARVHTVPIPAFVPAYATAMLVNDSITAILLFTQFRILRSRAILVLASGYAFNALILVPWILAFPGAVAPNGLIGGLQTTSWLYFLAHAGFPAFVIGYALSKDPQPATRSWRGPVDAAIAWSLALTAAAVAAAAIVFVAAEPHLPRVVLDPLHLSPLWPYVGAPVALTSTAALALLWIRRHSMLDLWLMVVMCLYSIEIPLSYYPDPVRYSLGWYTVRIIGFLSSLLVLVALLYEITNVYARLLDAVRAQRREREARLMTGDAVAAMLAHEVRQPLTAMITSADAGLRFLDRPAPDVERVKQALERIVADGHRAGDVVGSVRAIFKKDLRSRTSLDVNDLAQEALELARAEAQRCRISVEIEMGRALPAVQGDRIQLQQVLLNLITNAIEAMASASEPRILRVSSGRDGAEAVVVSVIDTGTGIGGPGLERIFNPLYTTKADGMGMGLSICRSIIEGHQGRLWATPNEGRGMTFAFSLPTR
jgi:signal transduction histidine kinase